MVIKTRETNGTGVTNNNAPLSNSDLDNNFVELVAADATKLENVSEDTSPTLGGDLDAGGNSINFENAGAYASYGTGDGTNTIHWETALPDLDSSHASVTGGSSIFQSYSNSFWGQYDILEIVSKNTAGTGSIVNTADSEINFFTRDGNTSNLSQKFFINKNGVTVPTTSDFSITGGGGAGYATCARNLMFTRNYGSISFGDTTTGVVVDQDNSYNTDFYDKRSSGGSHIRMLGAMANGTNQYALDVDFDSSNNSSNVELFADGSPMLKTDSTGLIIGNGTTSWTLTKDDGTSGQVLTTDGSGTTSWTTVSSGGGATAPVFSSAYDSTVSGITLQPNNDWKRIQVVLHADYGANFPSGSGNTTPRLGISLTTGSSNTSASWKKYMSDLFSHNYYAQIYYSASSYIYYDYFNKNDLVTIEFWKVASGSNAHVMYEVQFLEGDSATTSNFSSFWNLKGITNSAVTNSNYTFSITPAGAANWFGCNYMTRIEY